MWAPSDRSGQEHPLAGNQEVAKGVPGGVVANHLLGVPPGQGTVGSAGAAVTRGPGEWACTQEGMYQLSKEAEEKVKTQSHPD